MQISCATLTISQPKVLIVEGKDDANFFEALIKHLNLQSIQVIPINGKQTLKSKIAAIKAIPGFTSKVTSIGLALDADDDCNNAFRSVTNCLRSLGFSIPKEPLQTAGDNPKVSIMLLPSYNTNGMLEDLCLKSIQNDAAMPCLEAFFQCANVKDITQNMAKAKVHAFLATRAMPDKRLGEAALANYWPFNDPAFNEVKDFVSML